MATYKIEVQLTTAETYDHRVVEQAVLRGLATREFRIAGHARVVAKLDQEPVSGWTAAPTGQVRP